MAGISQSPVVATSVHVPGMLTATQCLVNSPEFELRSPEMGIRRAERT